MDNYKELIVVSLRKAAEVFVKAFVNALNDLLEFIKDKWETIKQYVLNNMPAYKEPTHPASKARTMSMHTVRSQVIDRKPKLIHARTTC